MRRSRTRLRGNMSASQRRRTLRKTEHKIINRRQMLYLQGLAEEHQATLH